MHDNVLHISADRLIDRANNVPDSPKNNKFSWQIVFQKTLQILTGLFSLPLM